MRYIKIKRLFLKGLSKINGTVRSYVSMRRNSYEYTQSVISVITLLLNLQKKKKLRTVIKIYNILIKLSTV